MPKYCYVYVLRSLADHQFYVGLTRDLRTRLQAHNKRLVASAKKRVPFELVYWEGCLNQSDAAQREKYLKSAWASAISKTVSENISPGKDVSTTIIYTHVLNRPGIGVKSPLD